jgi:hypothetical protein
MPVKMACGAARRKRACAHYGHSPGKIGVLPWAAAKRAPYWSRMSKPGSSIRSNWPRSFRFGLVAGTDGASSKVMALDLEARLRALAAFARQKSFSGAAAELFILPAVLAAFRQANPGVAVELRFGTSLTVVEAVRSHQSELGLVGGLVAAPELGVEPLLEDQVVLIGSPALGGRITISAVYPAGTLLTPLAERFLERVRQVCALVTAYSAPQAFIK